MSEIIINQEAVELQIKYVECEMNDLCSLCMHDPSTIKDIYLILLRMAREMEECKYALSKGVVFNEGGWAIRRNKNKQANKRNKQK